ncbi:hypothetical protein STCU_10162 [Strigomonas culicis]|uniref:Uncharacterized protein n=1 Tax=Strigomonas culicis TaxID=28005 RepID=S9TJB1_9TRYP|nr:hypothetical protein STCU_10162 [Strigomonas culicis]|eukprot:EPY18142.1 hypothetical protein STCU_10162 [Strigomonas culicis]
MCLLRSLLAYELPHLVLPPLHPKSALGTMEAHCGAKGEVSMKRESLRFFLQELCVVSEAVFCSPFFAAFFTESRDSFQAGLRPDMQSTLARYESASKPLHAFSKRGSAGGQSTADRLAQRSTSTLRSVVSYFSAVGGGGGRPTDGDGDAADFGLTATDETLLPADAQAWLREGRRLLRRERHLKRSAALFETYLHALDGRSKLQAEVKTCLCRLDSSFEDENPQRFGCAFRDTAQFFHHAAESEQDYVRRRYLHVVFALESERRYAAAALDAIDHVLCLYARLVYMCDGAAEERRVAEGLSAMLRENYENMYLKRYRVRMQSLSEAQLSTEWKRLAEQVDRTAKLCLGKAGDDRVEP